METVRKNMRGRPAAASLDLHLALIPAQLGALLKTNEEPLPFATILTQRTYIYFYSIV